MKNLNMRKLITVIAIVALVGLGATAFAHWEGGWHRGPGYHHRGWGGGPESGYGPMMGGLSGDEIKAFEKERQAFFKETASLRKSLFSKELELRSELAKENPDAGKANQLQKEISDLESQLDQKRVDHMIKMRKINPDAGRGYMMGRGGTGYGPGYHRGMGCWE
jgi:Spy/CpxP family protein refolding chaperone